MKLLFDENLSPRLVDFLSDNYPDSMHVEQAGLGGAGDSQVWLYAREHNFSKDSDFADLSVLKARRQK